MKYLGTYWFIPEQDVFSSDKNPSGFLTAKKPLALTICSVPPQKIKEYRKLATRSLL